MNINQTHRPIPVMSVPTTNLSFYEGYSTTRENLLKHFNAGLTLASLSRHPFSLSQNKVSGPFGEPHLSNLQPQSGTPVSVSSSTLLSSRFNGISPFSSLAWSNGVSNIRKRPYPSTGVSAFPSDGSSPKKRPTIRAGLCATGTKRSRRGIFKKAWCPIILGKQISTAKNLNVLSREGCRNFRRLTVSKTEFPDQSILRLQCLIRKSLKRHGICVLNRFNGLNFGSSIENEVKELHNSRFCHRGQSMGGQDTSKQVRQDLVTWIDGSEPAYPQLSSLCAKLDQIVGTGEGITQEYDICGGTKAMIARYAGNGAGYQLHVDNPSKDGRCLTCIYYLNKNWNTETMGGSLRLYSRTSRKIANIEPFFDRIVFFYSDERNPHEVLPAFEDRYAVTLWYFDRKERAKAIKRMVEQAGI
ncbi:egl nine homolog 1-like [Styela clava]